ncbi:hypothetical protein B0H19DRAFT_141969 [Mycena capillaripes]|nr:hypothetical protein B0H19DRAFT_141969 [Mycena capillaripes]
MQDIKRLVGSAFFFPLAHFAAGISLLNPTSDVAQNTSLDCQWNADPGDPATFSLVMQFFNGITDFGENAMVTTVRRGIATTGVVNGIQNVIHLGSHRLAAYVDPFDPKTQPFAVSPSFKVVANSTSASTSSSAIPPILTMSSAPTSNLRTDWATPTSTFTTSSSSVGSSASRSKSRTPIIVAATIGCTALALGILGTVFLMLRRRKTRTLDLLRGRPFPLSSPEPVHPSSSSNSAQVVAQRLEKAEFELENLRAEMHGLRLEREVPPSYFSV